MSMIVLDTIGPAAAANAAAAEAAAAAATPAVIADDPILSENQHVFLSWIRRRRRRRRESSSRQREESDRQAQWRSYYMGVGPKPIDDIEDVPTIKPTFNTPTVEPSGCLSPTFSTTTYIVSSVGSVENVQVEERDRTSSAQPTTPQPPTSEVDPSASPVMDRDSPSGSIEPDPLEMARNILNSGKCEFPPEIKVAFPQAPTEKSWIDVLKERFNLRKMILRLRRRSGRSSGRSSPSFEDEPKEPDDLPGDFERDYNSNLNVIHISSGIIPDEDVILPGMVMPY
ncbi:uncharacterized protein [Antedon mediterranea]|uniref:uncharacterized protein n=1 Tax=Antedon mediterranea TaxID=105859 RepID=UPI003AF75731